MKTKTSLLLLSILLLLASLLPLSATVTVRHSFEPNDGVNPTESQMVYVSTTEYWYGVVNGGGLYGKGILFRVKGDGSSYEILHHFGSAGDGAGPNGPLVNTGSTLIGVTWSGGTSDKGTLFSIGTGGTGYTILFHFTGSENEGGANPIGLSYNPDLSILFGASYSGGTYDKGALFSYDWTIDDLQGIRSFGNTGDGAYPSGAPIITDDEPITVYGTTSSGGANGHGSIYRLNATSKLYSLRYSFTGSPGGATPTGNLVKDSSGVLYGITKMGGTAGGGTVFQYNDSSSSFSVLKSFNGLADGWEPRGSLILDSGTLYGVAYSGGTNDLGTIFSITTGGSFALLKSFSGGAAEGQSPLGALSLGDGFLFGMTSQGGLSNMGTVYKIATGGGSFALLHSFIADGGTPYGDLIEYGGTLYGMTRWGGTANLGAIFKVQPDGTGFTVLHSFAGGNDDGKNPYGSLMVLDGVLYGMTAQGGSSDFGTIFRINPDGSDFSLLHRFDGTATDGKEPQGSLLAWNGVLYGMTTFGGLDNQGTIFQINPDGLGFSVRHSFSSTFGMWPHGSLTNLEGTFYGMTTEGGEHNDGTVFKTYSYSTAFSVLKSFDCDLEGGEYPEGSLVVLDGILYGVNYGRSNILPTYGTVFRINPANSEYAIVKAFSDGSGELNHPVGSLVVANGTLFGMAHEGGANGMGGIFRVDPDGSDYANIHSFAGTDGGHPYGSLLFDGSTFFGMTLFGGSVNKGVIFSRVLGIYSFYFAAGTGGSLSGTN